MANKVVKDILEKMKKVEGGYLDQPEKGDDEQSFIDKHVDNVQVTDGPGVEKENGHPHNGGEKQAMAPRKKHRKGYEPKEDAEVYETVSFDDDLQTIMENMTLEESTDFLFEMIDEAVAEFIDEEATEEEAEIIREMFESEEGCAEFLELMFEEKCKDCGCEECECDGDDDVIDDSPKLKKEKGSKKSETMATQEEVERHADVKMVKIKTSDGKVVYRKQRAETEVSKKSD